MSTTVHQAIASVIRDLPAVGKDQKVTEGPARYQYRGIEQIKAALKPLLALHGVHYAPTEIAKIDDTTYQSGSGATWQRVRMVVRYRIYGPDGSHIEAVGRGEGADNSDKACNKAMTVAEKQVLCQVFCIADADGDPDANRPDEEVADTRPPVDIKGAKHVLIDTIGKERAAEWWRANDPGPGPLSAAEWDRVYAAATKWAEQQSADEPAEDVSPSSPADSVDEGPGDGAKRPGAAPPSPPTKQQMTRLTTALRGAGLTEDEWADWCSLTLSRDVDALTDLSREEVASLTDKASAVALMQGADS